MAEENTSEKKKAAWRFFRSHLCTKVWDKENNCLLADFSAGHFTTEDPRVAKILKDKGYPQIPLDAETPPEVMVSQPTMSIEGDVPVLGRGITEGLGEATVQSKTQQVGGPQPPKVVSRVEV